MIFILLILLISFSVGIGLFFYKGVNMSKLAKRANYEKPWLAYIPCFNNWLKASVGHESKGRATTAIVLNLISFVLGITFLGILIVLVIQFIFFSDLMLDVDIDILLSTYLFAFVGGVACLIIAAIISLINQFIVIARIDMSFIDAFNIEEGVSSLVVNNVRNGWAYGNLLSKLAARKDLAYKFEKPAF